MKRSKYKTFSRFELFSVEKFKFYFLIEIEISRSGMDSLIRLPADVAKARVEPMWFPEVAYVVSSSV